MDLYQIMYEEGNRILSNLICDDEPELYEVKFEVVVGMGTEGNRIEIEKYNVLIFMIVNYTSRPYVYLSVGNLENKNYKSMILFSFNLDKVTQKIVSIVTDVFNVNPSVQRKICQNIVNSYRVEYKKYRNNWRERQS